MNIINLLHDIKEYWFGPTSDISSQLKEIGFGYIKNAKKEYHTYPKNGHEFYISPHPTQDGVFQVRCSYYGLTHTTLNTDNLVEDLSLHILTKPEITHKFKRVQGLAPKPSLRK